jgi:hypothetical protein
MLSMATQEGLDFSNDTSAESQYANHKDNAQHDGAE